MANPACAGAFIGAVAGGVSGGANNAYQQSQSSCPFNWGSFGNSVLSGAATGGLSGALFGGAFGFASGGAVAPAIAFTAQQQASQLAAAAAARGTLRTAMSTPAGQVAHHAIPIQALHAVPGTMSRAIAGGFNINGANNGVNLIHGITHQGPHSIYNQAVISQLKTIPTNLTSAQTAAKVQGIATQLQNAARNGTFLPL